MACRCVQRGTTGVERGDVRHGRHQLPRAEAADRGRVGRGRVGSYLQHLTRMRLRSGGFYVGSRAHGARRTRHRLTHRAVRDIRWRLADDLRASASVLVTRPMTTLPTSPPNGATLCEPDTHAQARSRALEVLKYLAAGVAFGILVVKSEVVSWYRIQEMFRILGIIFGTGCARWCVPRTALRADREWCERVRRRGIRTAGGNVDVWAAAAASPH